MNLDEYDGIVMSGRPIRPEEYITILNDSDRWSMWVDAAARAEVPPLYPGAIGVPCSVCGIEMQVGPRQQEQAATVDSDKIAYLCLVDVVLQMAQMGPNDHLTIQDLGNTYKENP